MKRGAAAEVDLIKFMTDVRKGASGRKLDAHAKVFAHDLKQQQLAVLQSMNPDGANFEDECRKAKPLADRLTDMVATDILASSSKKEMVHVIEFYLKVAHESLKAGDYQSALFLSTAINTKDIERLGINEDISKVAKAQLAEIRGTIDNKARFQQFNQFLKTQNGPNIVPIAPSIQAQYVGLKEKKGLADTDEVKESLQTGIDETKGILRNFVRNAHPEPMQSNLMAKLAAPTLPYDSAYSSGEKDQPEPVTIEGRSRILKKAGANQTMNPNTPEAKASTAAVIQFLKAQPASPLPQLPPAALEAAPTVTPPPIAVQAAPIAAPSSNKGKQRKTIAEDGGPNYEASQRNAPAKTSSDTIEAYNQLKIELTAAIEQHINHEASRVYSGRPDSAKRAIHDDRWARQDEIYLDRINELGAKIEAMEKQFPGLNPKKAAAPIVPPPSAAASSSGKAASSSDKGKEEMQAAAGPSKQKARKERKTITEDGGPDPMAAQQPAADDQKQKGRVDTAPLMEPVEPAATATQQQQPKARINAKPIPRSSAEPKRSDMNILKADVKLLAAELKQKHLQMIKNVDSDELYAARWDKPNAQTSAPNIVAIINDYNKITQQVKQDILFAKSPKEQKNAYLAYAKLMNEASTIGDYHTANAIYISLYASPAISRLVKNFETSETKKIIQKHVVLFDTSDNNRNIKAEMEAKRQITSVIPLTTHTLQKILTADGIPVPDDPVEMQKVESDIHDRKINAIQAFSAYQAQAISELNKSSHMGDWPDTKLDTPSDDDLYALSMTIHARGTNAKYFESKQAIADAIDNLKEKLSPRDVTPEELIELYSDLKSQASNVTRMLESHMSNYLERQQQDTEIASWHDTQEELTSKLAELSNRISIMEIENPGLKAAARQEATSVSKPVAAAAQEQPAAAQEQPAAAQEQPAAAQEQPAAASVQEDKGKEPAAGNDNEELKSPEPVKARKIKIPKRVEGQPSGPAPLPPSSSNAPVVQQVADEAPKRKTVRFADEVKSQDAAPPIPPPPSNREKLKALSRAYKASRKAEQSQIQPQPSAPIQPTAASVDAGLDPIIKDAKQTDAKNKAESILNGLSKINAPEVKVNDAGKIEFTVNGVRNSKALQKTLKEAGIECQVTRGKGGTTFSFDAEKLNALSFKDVQDLVKATRKEYNKLTKERKEKHKAAMVPEDTINTAPPPAVPQRPTNARLDQIVQETAASLEAEAKTSKGSKAEEAKQIAAALREKAPPLPAPTVVKVDTPAVSAPPQAAASRVPVDAGAQLASMLNSPMPNSSITAPPILETVNTNHPSTRNLDAMSKPPARRQQARAAIAIANDNQDVTMVVKSEGKPVVKTFETVKQFWHAQDQKDMQAKQTAEQKTAPSTKPGSKTKPT